MNEDMERDPHRTRRLGCLAFQHDGAGECKGAVKVISRRLAPRIKVLRVNRAIAFDFASCFAD